MSITLLSTTLRRGVRLLPHALVLCAIAIAPARAQDPPPAMALTSVTIHNSDGSTLAGASIIWRNGIVEAVGQGLDVPFDAFVVDGGDSLHVYPGFIDGLNTWGSPEAPTTPEPTPVPGNPSPARAGVQPERTPSTHMKADHASYSSAMKAGFTAANLVPEGRMLPGRSEIVLLDGAFSRADVVGEPTALVFRFQGAAGGWSNRAYPSTDMAVMAKFRQTLYDAQALREHIAYTTTRQGGDLPVAQRDPILEAMFPVLEGKIPVLFETDSPEDLERFLMLKDEFGFDAIIASGEGLATRAALLRERGIPVLASLDVPGKPDWMVEQEKAEAAEADTSTSKAESSEPELPGWAQTEREAFRARQMDAWNRAVSNVRSLREAGVLVGYAGHGLDLKDLPGKIQILTEEGGLTETDLLEMMTVNTARILGGDSRLGALNRGSIANISVFDKPFTESKASVVMSVSNGVITRL